jgi:hypothetical protein
MSEHEALRRLEQAWKDASGDARYAVLVVRYRKKGAAGESTIHIMGQVNGSMSPSWGLTWPLCPSDPIRARHELVMEAVTPHPCPVGPFHRSSLTCCIDTAARQV